MKNTLTPDDQIALTQEVMGLVEADVDHVDLLDYLAIPGFALTKERVEDHDTLLDETLERMSEDHDRQTVEAVDGAFGVAEVYIFNEMADVENWQMLASRAYFQIIAGRPIPLEECLS